MAEPNDTRPDFDPRCPLRVNAGHVCANRDRNVTDPEPLRPGSACFEGARADMRREVNEINAQQAAIAAMKKCCDLFEVMRHYNLAGEDVELEFDAATDAILDAQLAMALAGWQIRPPLRTVAS